MIHSINIKDNLTLYRADKDAPPLKWSSSFKNSQYHYPEMGYKNKSGLFFFTDSIEIAITIGKKFNLETYYLTECKVKESAKIIDFSFCNTIFEMVTILTDLGIDILTNDFKSYNNTTGPHITSFGDFKSIYEELQGGSVLLHKFHLGMSDNHNVGYFGQRLTDFDNAQHFLKLVKKFGLDGYRWRESYDPRGLTYCFFDSSKISNPETQIISTLP